MTFPENKSVRSQLEAESQQRAAAVAKLPPGSHVHISGVCGTGMASVLSLLKTLGYRVTGSDKSFYPPMGDVVRRLCDKVYEGYSAENLSDQSFSSGPNLVVIGNSLSKSNPEVEAVLSSGIPYASMPEVFSALLIGTREHCPTSIVVSGTHGKTTTTAAIGVMLDVAGRKPGYFVGGLPLDLPGSIRPVDPSIPKEERVVVLEGDEYDSAFFAKWSKFHSYRPDIVIVTSLEFDHADIFADIEQIENEFTLLVERVPKGGIVLVCDQSARLRLLAEGWAKSSEVEAEVVFYGESADCEFRLVERRPSSAGGQELTFVLDGKTFRTLTPLSGPHNALNLLALAAVGAKLGIEHSLIQKGIETFRGVLRRQQVIGEVRGITVIEDFAHHPTAVKVTLQGLREAYPGRRLVAVFEPRSNTSRRSVFQEEYAKSFQGCDEVILLEVPEQQIYSATNSPVVILDVKTLAAGIATAGTPSQCFASTEAIENYLVSSTRSGDVLVLMSNGDFGGLMKSLPKALQVAVPK